MSLLKNNPLFNSLITFSKKGIEIAPYTQIRTAITTRYKQIYGDDIDLSTSTADGQYIEMLCLIINNMLQSIKTVYSNLDVDTAQGKFLDMLSALTNVTRQPAQNSKVILKVTLTELNSLVVGPSYLGGQTESLSFLDKNGTEWTFKPSSAVTLVKDEEQSIIVESTIPGPVRADAGWIDRTLDASLLMTVVQNQAATIGSYEETDSQLRARRLQLLGSSGISVIQSLNAALMSLDGIEDVKIYNNDSDSATQAKDDTDIAAHSVYIILRKAATSALTKELIGTTLYEKMTPGIQFIMPGTVTGETPPQDGDTVTTGIAREYLYIQRVQGNIINSGVNQYARWKEATPVHPSIVIVLNKLSSYDSSSLMGSAYDASTSQIIASKVMEYMNSQSISTDGKSALIQMQAQMADPLFKGLPTFFITSVTVNGSSSDYVNKDTFYDYSSYSVSENGSTVTITIQ